MMGNPAHTAAWPDEYDERWDVGALEGYATAAGLHALDEARANYRQGAAVVDLARAEGLLDGGAEETPEAALLGLYARWIEVEVERDRAWSEYLSRHVPHGEEWHTLSASERRRITASEPPPDYDTALLSELAGEVISKWPDHPIADHARLAQLRAGLPHFDYDRPIDRTHLEPMTAIRDPRVVEQAAVTVADIGPFHDASPAVRDELLEVAAAPDNELRLLTWVMSRATRSGDWERAADAAFRLRRRLAASCGDGAPVGLACEQRAYELRDVTGRLGALGAAEPSTWQEALTAAAWRCHLTVGPHRGVSRTSARWDGRQWRFESWDIETPAAACLGSASPHPPPPEPLRLHLTLEGT